MRARLGGLTSGQLHAAGASEGLGKGGWASQAGIGWRVRVCTGPPPCFALRVTWALIWSLHTPNRLRLPTEALAADVHWSLLTSGGSPPLTFCRTVQGRWDSACRGCREQGWERGAPLGQASLDRGWGRHPVQGRGPHSRPLQALSPGTSQSTLRVSQGCGVPRLPQGPHSFFPLGLQRHKVGWGVSSPETYQRLGCPGQPAPGPRPELGRGSRPQY